MGAPDVLTNPMQQVSRSDPATDLVAATLRSKQVVQQIPVYQPAFQFTVPSRQFNRGWISQDVPTVPGPTYIVPDVQAPEIQYSSKAYRGLIALAANPLNVSNRPSVQLTAPGIETSFNR